MTRDDLRMTPGERQHPASQHAVCDPQGILIRPTGCLLSEELRSRIRDCEAPRVTCDAVFEEPSEPEVCNLDPAADDQDIMGLQVAVLDSDRTLPEVVRPAIEEIEPLCR